MSLAILWHFYDKQNPSRFIEIHDLWFAGREKAAVALGVATEQLGVFPAPEPTPVPVIVAPTPPTPPPRKRVRKPPPKKKAKAKPRKAKKRRR